MKNILVLLALCWTIGAIAQSDSVSLGAGATNMVFYNVATGAKTVAANDDWHLAFTVKAAIPPYNTNQAAAIRINEAYGLKLFRSPNQKLDVWSSFDTTGYTSWQQMHNPDTTWTIGAFNINKNFGDDYNYGWGEYAFALHSVESDLSICYNCLMENSENLRSGTWTTTLSSMCNMTSLTIQISQPGISRRNLIALRASYITTSKLKP
jgi:hypothetical protein